MSANSDTFAGGSAEAGPGGIPEEGNAALLRDVRHPDEVPFLALAGVEGVLNLLSGIPILVQHEFLGEVPLVGLVSHRDLPSICPIRFPLVVRWRNSNPDTAKRV